MLRYGFHMDPLSIFKLPSLQAFLAAESGGAIAEALLSGKTGILQVVPGDLQIPNALDSLDAQITFASDT